MKALTLWQPWASLIALGVKSIETRAWSTSYRGPLAIHAAATTKGFDMLPGDCEGTVEGGWRYGYIGDFQAAHCFRSSDEGTRGETYLHCLNGPGTTSEPDPCPLGAVVATCTLVDVVPIIAPEENPFDRYPCVQTSLVSDWPDGWLELYHPTLGNPIDPEGSGLSIPQQAPFGDFSPGRYAWLLADVEPLAEPVPAKGRQGLWEWAA